MSIGPELVAVLPRLRRYAMTLCRSAVAADDLVQATCLRALAGQDGWTPGTRLDAWLFRIQRNLWIDTIRHKKIEGIMDDIEERHDLPAPNSERVAIDRLILSDVRAAIDRLPDEQREVLLLICGEEMTYREAADLVGVPVGTIMSRLARARQRLLEMTEAA